MTSNKCELKKRRNRIFQNIIGVDFSQNSIDSELKAKKLWQLTTGRNAPILQRTIELLDLATLEIVKVPAKRHSITPTFEFPVSSKFNKLLIAKTGKTILEAVQRKLRKYRNQNLPKMLDEEEVEYRAHSRFPLEWFDDYEYETMTPNAWMEYGPIPAIAYIPGEVNRKRWSNVTVNGFDEKTDKWQITENSSQNNYSVSRLFLVFLAEDYNYYIARIKNAIDFREKCIKSLKFGITVDCLTFHGISDMSLQLIARIYKLALRNRPEFQHHLSECAFEDILAQVKVDYQRTMCAIELGHKMVDSPDDYCNLTIPDDFKCYPTWTTLACEDSVNQTKTAFNRLNQISLYSVVESGQTILKMVEDGLRILETPMFCCDDSRGDDLDSFVQYQNEYTGDVLRNLKRDWVHSTSRQIRTKLQPVKRGTFNTTISDWNLYFASKISRLVSLFRHHMQSTLKTLIMDSTLQYSEFLAKPCDCFSGIEANFEWGVVLNKSPFSPKESHIFSMTLEINETDPFLSTDPDAFAPALVKIYDDTIRGTHSIPQVDPILMTGLIYSKDVFLSSVGLMDADIEDRRQRIKTSYENGAIPLKAYASSFQDHVAFYNLILSDYVTQIVEEERSAWDIKDLIIFQMNMIDKIRAEFPSALQIGPFLVIVEGLKQFLVKKYHELKMLLLEMFARRLTSETQQIIDDYTVLYKKLTDTPRTIEQIFKLKEWTNEIPELVQAKDEEMSLKLVEYEILSCFYHALTGPQFKVKWDAIAWPQRIFAQVSNALEMYDKYTEVYQRQQVFDLSNYEAQVQSVNSQVVSYSKQYDPSRATELSIEMKKLYKTIRDTEEMGVMLNVRQELFGLPGLDLEMYQGLLEGFQPYRDMWTAMADFRKYRDMWCGNAFINIETPAIREQVDELLTIIQTSVTTFEELPKVQEVALFAIQEIEDFKPEIDVMEWLRNPMWTGIHWMRLGKMSGSEIKFSTAMNFDYLLRKNIMDSAELVKEISENATIEWEAIQAAELEAERLKKEEEEKELAKLRRREERSDLF